MFVDEARVDVSAGRGGNGCVSFRPEEVRTPRTLPPSTARLEVLSWEGKHRFTLQDGK